VEVVVAGPVGVLVGVVGVVVEVDVIVVEVDVDVVRGFVSVAVLVVFALSVLVPTVPPQSFFASVRTVAAPWLRSDTSVGLTAPGRFATWVSTAPIAFSALPQSPFARSAEAVLS